jgi:hypothetical protein
MHQRQAQRCRNEARWTVIPARLRIGRLLAVFLPAFVMALAGLAVPSNSADQAAQPESIGAIRAASSEDSAAAPTAEAIDTRRALILCGHPGDDQHRTMYAETIERLHAALTARFGFDADEIRVLFGAETGSDDGPALASARGLSTRENVEAQVAELRQVLQPNDGLWVIVLGHTHYDGRYSYLNLPGPDMHEQEFGKLFAGLTAREQIFFITTAASGFYIKPLSAQGRIVISATEADREVNETIFHLALADVLTDPRPLEPPGDEPPGDEPPGDEPPGDEPPADEQSGVAPPESVSVFDLYIAITRNVAARYAEDELLSTEHAQLDDNGDGRGSELQLDYLPEEQGGRPAGSTKAIIGPTADGALSMRTQLKIAPVEN